MGPHVPFAPALLTLSLHIILHIYFISSRLFILLYVTCVMVNKAVEKKRKRTPVSNLVKSMLIKSWLSNYSILRTLKQNELSSLPSFES